MQGGGSKCAKAIATAAVQSGAGGYERAVMGGANGGGLLQEGESKAEKQSMG